LGGGRAASYQALVDREDVPMGVQLSAANAHNYKDAEQLVEIVLPIRRSRI
jgi:hypothetical protein